MYFREEAFDRSAVLWQSRAEQWARWQLNTIFQRMDSAKIASRLQTWSKKDIYININIYMYIYIYFYIYI